MASGGRKSSAILAAVVGPAAVFLAVSGDVGPVAASGRAEAVVNQAAAPAETGPPCCAQIVAAGSSAVSVGLANAGPDQVVSASRWRRVDRALPVGLAPERGLQVRTILVARSISAFFPEIRVIGGMRPDSLRWHPNGLALDVMIPNPGSAQGIALGNEIVAYVLKNAERFGMQDAIWRDVYYTPKGARRSGLGHYDHVHITTTGGGYPTGNEVYIR